MTQPQSLLHPCEQAVPIAKLEVTTEQIGKTLERLGNVLERIAEQSNRVETLEENQEILFFRVRNIEISAAKEQTKVGFLVTGIAAGVSATTAGIMKLLMK